MLAAKLLKKETSVFCIANIFASIKDFNIYISIDISRWKQLSLLVIGRHTQILVFSSEISAKLCQTLSESVCSNRRPMLILLIFLSINFRNRHIFPINFQNCNLSSIQFSGINTNIGHF